MNACLRARMRVCLCMCETLSGSFMLRSDVHSLIGLKEEVCVTLFSPPPDNNNR